MTCTISHCFKQKDAVSFG